MPDATKLDLVGAWCGGDYYVRANEASLFTVPKPLGVMGMGVDALPEDIRTSHVLTGNHLAMLGGCETVPRRNGRQRAQALVELADVFMEHEGDGAQLEQVLHRKGGRTFGQRDGG